ncbi:TGS domain-containing protein, partial [Candidatus Woesearchaeota archaeon]|nr:TGS domain-containing protein [Candidatus Woesearchaeota archaeon]
MTIKITFPDGKTKSFRKGITAEQVAAELGVRNAITAKIDGELKDLSAPINADSKLLLLKYEDAEGREVFWHTSSHIIAQAITRLYPDAKLTIGPNWESGFFYDIDM